MIPFFDRFFGTITPLLFILLLTSCQNDKPKESLVGELNKEIEKKVEIIPGAENVAEYFTLIEGKSVGLVVNQTSLIGQMHLVDSLLKLNLSISKIFSPEHGFRGEADAGEKIEDNKDPKTGIDVISLYGKKKKPLPEDLKNIDVIVFDIQDVGARFYTYISTLHYVMEACAEQNIPVIILDRPNPNAHYIDGPVLEKEYKSFVGMHPVPVVYGMTIGEYGKMINGELWLKNNVKADLTVIPCSNYNHDSYYSLPVKPSPNLPNDRSIMLYPSLCFFEGTTVSIGRGTEKQFQLVGHPNIKTSAIASKSVPEFTFTPKSTKGAKYPKNENLQCGGLDLSKLTTGSLFDMKKLDLSYLIDAHRALKKQNKPFFNKNNFFEKLAGTSTLREQLNAGLTEEEIRISWQPAINTFKEIRKNYLIY